MYSLLLTTLAISGNPVDIPPSDICEAVSYEVQEAVKADIITDQQAFLIEMRCFMNYS